MAFRTPVATENRVYSISVRIASRGRKGLHRLQQGAATWNCLASSKAGLPHGLQLSECICCLLIPNCISRINGVASCWPFTLCLRRAGAFLTCYATLLCRPRIPSLVVMYGFDENLYPPTHEKCVAEGVYLLQQAAYDCSLGSLSYQLKSRALVPLAR